MIQWLANKLEKLALKWDWTSKQFLRYKRANRSRIDRVTKAKYHKARKMAVEAINQRLEYKLPVPVPDAEEFIYDEDRYQRQHVSRYSRRR